jgi:hypothetical protein
LRSTHADLKAAALLYAVFTYNAHITQAANLIGRHELRYSEILQLAQVTSKRLAAAAAAVAAVVLLAVTRFRVV